LTGADSTAGAITTTITDNKTAIETEETRAIAAETTLQSNIDNLNTSVTSGSTFVNATDFAHYSKPIHIGGDTEPASASLEVTGNIKASGDVIFAGGLKQDDGAGNLSDFRGGAFNIVEPNISNTPIRYYVDINSDADTAPYYIFSSTSGGTALNSSSQPLSLQKGVSYIFEATIDNSTNIFNIGSGHRENNTGISVTSTGMNGDFTITDNQGVASIYIIEELSFTIPNDYDGALKYYSYENPDRIGDFNIIGSQAEYAHYSNAIHIGGSTEPTDSKLEVTGDVKISGDVKITGVFKQW
jgi:hypothetical protein